MRYDAAPHTTYHSMLLPMLEDIDVGARWRIGDRRFEQRPV